MAGYWESSFNTFLPLSHLRFYPSPPSSILIQYQERQSLPRVIYKRWSNLQTSSKLHRVISSHFSVHFCAFHSRPVAHRDSHRQCGSISCNASLYRWGKKKKKVACIFLSLSGLFRALFWHRLPLLGLTAKHRLSLCCDRRGRERERVRQRERGSQQAADGGGGRELGLPGGRLVPLLQWVIAARRGGTECRGLPVAEEANPLELHLSQQLSLSLGAAVGGRRGKFPNLLARVWSALNAEENSQRGSVFFPFQARSPPSEDMIFGF